MILAKAIAALLLLGLWGCTTVEESASRLWSSNTNATAAFGGRVLQGKANFIRTREATLHLQTDDAPVLSCFGPMRFTGTGGGIVTLTCSDGTMASIPFQTLSELRGWGRGQVGDSPFTITYGLAPDVASAYLAVPADRLVRPKLDAAGKPISN